MSTFLTRLARHKTKITQNDTTFQNRPQLFLANAIFMPQSLFSASRSLNFRLLTGDKDQAGMIRQSEKKGFRPAARSSGEITQMTSPWSFSK